jgi:X-X-X-Leu-X-X-Gly heptad repeat protein
MNAVTYASSAVSSTSALNSGAATIAAGSQQLNRDAQQIADPDGQNPTDSLLDLDQSKRLSAAGAAVISTSDKMLGSLLDAFA